MGQQQLLLLVLATVIVGLATVAGIQAFDEGQQQAAQDALTQRALTIGQNISAATKKPSQLGGITLSSSDASQIAAAAGYGDSGDGDGTGIPATGAGDGATCDIADDGLVTCNGPDDDLSTTVDPTGGSDGGAQVTEISGESLS
jgi:hypothetical protein